MADAHTTTAHPCRALDLPATAQPLVQARLCGPLPHAIRSPPPAAAPLAAHRATGRVHGSSNPTRLVGEFLPSFGTTASQVATMTNILISHEEDGISTNI